MGNKQGGKKLATSENALGRRKSTGGTPTHKDVGPPGTLSRQSTAGSAQSGKLAHRSTAGDDFSVIREKSPDLVEQKDDARSSLPSINSGYATDGKHDRGSLGSDLTQQGIIEFKESQQPLNDRRDSTNSDNSVTSTLTKTRSVSSLMSLKSHASVRKIKELHKSGAIETSFVLSTQEADDDPKPMKQSVLQDALNMSQIFHGVGFMELPRGGYIVRSRTLGPIQFGIPPETIKDSLARGMPVPKYFVIQGEMFDRKVGLSKAEFEFPIYYQYFVARSRVNIVTTKDLEIRIRSALKETLLGPGTECNVAEDYPTGTPSDALPNFEAEASSLDPHRESTKLDDVVNFILFDENIMQAVIEAEGTRVTIAAFAAEDRIKGGTKPMFEVKEGDQVLAHVPATVKVGTVNALGGLHLYNNNESSRSKHAHKLQMKRNYEVEERQHLEAKQRTSNLSSLDDRIHRSSATTTSTAASTGECKPPEGISRPRTLSIDTSRIMEMPVLPSPLPQSTPRTDLRLFNVQMPKFEPFEIPIFGVTMMGASHGFDAAGRTTGFVLWMSRRGIIVDPPPDSAKILELKGVPPRAIEGIILTHTHADHDAGTFQRILRTRAIKLYTTRTIERSFIKKYSAITGFDPAFLRSLFTFIPVQCGENGALKINSGEIRFSYSLHTIPCIGFEAYFGEHSLVYSADTRYDPDLCQRLLNEGKIGRRRAEQLSSFPYNHTVILHELGVPPIHTPKETLAKAAHDQKHYRKGKPLSSRLFVVHASAGAAEGFALQCYDWDTITITVEQGRVKQLSEINSVLTNIDWLEPLGKETLHKIAKQCRFFTIESGDSIVTFNEGEPPQSVWIVLAGMVHSTLDEAEIYTVGDCYGEEGILADLEFGTLATTKITGRRVAGVPLSMEVVTGSMRSMQHKSGASPHVGTKSGKFSEGGFRDFPVQTFKAVTKAYVVEVSNKILLKYISRSKLKKREVTEKLRKSNGYPYDPRWCILQRNAPLMKLLASQLAVREFLENLSDDYVSYPGGYVLEDGRGSWNPTSAYFIKEGVLRVIPLHAAFSFRASGVNKLPGRNEGIHTFECARGSLVGDFNALIKREKSPYRIVCAEDCEIYHLELNQLDKLFEEFPGIKFQLVDRVILGWMLDVQVPDGELDVFGGHVMLADSKPF